MRGRTKRISKKETEYTISQHLKELKHRIIAVIIVFLICFIALFIYINGIFLPILEEGVTLGYSFISLSPQEVLVQEFRVAGSIALLLSCPFALYQLAAYIVQPEGVKQRAKAISGISVIMILFIIGTIFSIKIMLPFMLKFLLESSEATGYIKPEISVKEYMGFYISVITIFGVTMEMPALTVILGKIGLITPKRLKRFRPYIVIAIFIIAAIVTPPDVISQLMVAIPMIVIYEICILISRFILREKRRKEENDI